MIAWGLVPGLTWVVLTVCPWMTTGRTGPRSPARGPAPTALREPTGLRKELPHHDHRPAHRRRDRLRRRHPGDGRHVPDRPPRHQSDLAPAPRRGTPRDP